MGFLYRFRIHNTCDSIMRNMLKKKTYIYISSNCLIVVYRQNNHSKKSAQICYHALQSAVTSAPGTKTEDVIVLWKQDSRWNCI